MRRRDLNATMCRAHVVRAREYDVYAHGMTVNPGTIAHWLDIRRRGDLAWVDAVAALARWAHSPRSNP